MLKKVYEHMFSNFKFNKSGEFPTCSLTKSILSSVKSMFSIVHSLCPKLSKNKVYWKIPQSIYNPPVRLNVRTTAIKKGWDQRTAQVANFAQASDGKSRKRQERSAKKTRQEHLAKKTSKERTFWVKRVNNRWQLTSKQ